MIIQLPNGQRCFFNTWREPEYIFFRANDKSVVAYFVNKQKGNVLEKVQYDSGLQNFSSLWINSYYPNGNNRLDLFAVKDTGDELMSGECDIDGHRYLVLAASNLHSPISEADSMFDHPVLLKAGSFEDSLRCLCSFNKDDDKEMINALFRDCENLGYDKIRTDFLREERVSIKIVFQYQHEYHNNEKFKWLVENGYGCFAVNSLGYALKTVKKKIDACYSLYSKQSKPFWNIPEGVQNLMNKQHNYAANIFFLHDMGFGVQELKAFKRLFGNFSDTNRGRFEIIRSCFPNAVINDLLSAIDKFRMHTVRGCEVKESIPAWFPNFNRVYSDLTPTECANALKNPEKYDYSFWSDLSNSSIKAKQESQMFENIASINALSKYADYCLPANFFGYKIKKINGLSDIEKEPWFQKEYLKSSYSCLSVPENTILFVVKGRNRYGEEDVNLLRVNLDRQTFYETTVTGGCHPFFEQKRGEEETIAVKTLKQRLADFYLKFSAENSVFATC